MSALVRSSHALLTSPYHVGIWSAQIAGFASLPLVFHYGIASKFNDVFVTADPPDVRGAERASTALAGRRESPPRRPRASLHTGGRG